jgi:hypothetical protein
MDLLEVIKGAMKDGKMSSYGTNPNAFICSCGYWATYGIVMDIAIGDHNIVTSYIKIQNPKQNFECLLYHHDWHNNANNGMTTCLK